MGRNYLAGQQGDAVNAILAAAGFLPPAQMAERFFVALDRSASAPAQSVAA